MKGIYCQKCGRKRKGMVCEHCGYPYVFIQLQYQGTTYRFFHDKTGKSYTYSAADQARRDMAVQVEAKTFNPKDWTKKAVEERKFINEFETFLNQKEKKLKPATKYLYETYNRLYFKPLHELSVTEIKLKHLQIWYDTLPSISAKYKKNMTDCLRTFFRWLHRWGDIKEIPIMPEIETAHSTPRTFIDYETQIEALQKIPEQHRGFFEFLMESGFRPGEACALGIIDVDVRNKRILVQRGYSKGILVESPKEGTKKWRTLSTRAYELVMSAIGSRAGKDFLFINPATGRGYKGEFLRRIWKKYSQTGVDLYSATRHSLASQLANEGVSQGELQDIMGHADPRSTARYIHFTEERKRQHLDNRGKVFELKSYDKSSR